MNLIFHLGIWVASWLACNQLDAMEVIPGDLQDSVGESWSFSKAFFWSCWHCMRRALRALLAVCWQPLPFLFFGSWHPSHSFTIPQLLCFCFHPLLLFIPLDFLTLVQSPAMWGIGKMKGKGLMWRVIAPRRGVGYAESFTTWLHFLSWQDLELSGIILIFQMRRLRLRRVN